MSTNPGTEEWQKYAQELEDYTAALRKENEELKNAPKSSLLTASIDWRNKLTDIAIWAALALAVVLFVNYRKGSPEPGPKPIDTIIADSEIVKKTFPSVIAAHRAVFEKAAQQVDNGDIKTDAELFAFVEPALEALSKEAKKPFNEMFSMSLPRNEDGTFSNEEKDHKPAVVKFLRMISEKW